MKIGQKYECKTHNQPQSLNAGSIPAGVTLFLFPTRNGINAYPFEAYLKTSLGNQFFDIFYCPKKEIYFSDLLFFLVRFFG